jgi:hypothetical protein
LRKRISLFRFESLDFIKTSMSATNIHNNRKTSQSVCQSRCMHRCNDFQLKRFRTFCFFGVICVSPLKLEKCTTKVWRREQNHWKGEINGESEGGKWNDSESGLGKTLLFHDNWIQSNSSYILVVFVSRREMRILLNLIFILGFQTTSTRETVLPADVVSFSFEI